MTKLITWQIQPTDLYKLGVDFVDGHLAVFLNGGKYIPIWLLSSLPFTIMMQQMFVRRWVLRRAWSGNWRWVARGRMCAVHVFPKAPISLILKAFRESRSMAHIHTVHQHTDQQRVFLGGNEAPSSWQASCKEETNNYEALPNISRVEPQEQSSTVYLCLCYLDPEETLLYSKVKTKILWILQGRILEIIIINYL